MTDQKTEDNTSNPEMHPHEDEELRISDILQIWWKNRGRLFLAAVAGLIAVVAIVGGVYLLRPSHQESTLAFRLLFDGAEKGEYPNGLRFTPADIVATPVLQEVYRRNDLESYIPFEEFKEAFAVVNINPALERLRREFQGRLEDRRLSGVDRRRIEDEYEARVQALKSGEFTLVSTVEGRLSDWPAGMMGKILEDILVVWADQSRARGVFKFDVGIFSENVLEDLEGDRDDYLVLLDRVRITINRILGDLGKLDDIPGAKLIRVGDRRVSLDELEMRLRDNLRYRLNAIEAPVYSLGLYRNRALAESYIQEQLFRLEVDIRAAKSREAALERALANYSMSRMGGGRFETAAADAVGSGGGGGGGLMPQISESFLDRILELSTQDSDIRFRQDLSEKTIEVSQEVVDLETERRTYENMLESLNRVREEDVLQRDEVRDWVDDQVDVLFATLRTVIRYSNLLHEEISRINLQPSMIYTITEPIKQRRVSPVGMKNVGLAAILGYGAFMGMVFIGSAWRNLR